MLPSPRLTIRPLVDARECSLKPTVIRHNPAALPHLEAVRARSHPPRRVNRERLLSPSRKPESSDEETRCEGYDRTSLVGASRRTDQQDSSVASGASIVEVRTQGGHDASAEATSRDKDPALTEASPRGELTRPETDTPRRVDRTETSLSSEKSPRRNSDTAHQRLRSPKATTTQALQPPPVQSRQLSPDPRHEVGSRDR